MTKIFVKSILKHNTQGNSVYVIYDLKSKKVITEFLVKNSTGSQCNYFGVCNAISLFPNATIYTPDKNVIKWIKDKKYNSKKYWHKHIEKCDAFLQNLEYLPNVLLWHNEKDGKINLKTNLI